MKMQSIPKFVSNPKFIQSYFRNSRSLLFPANRVYFSSYSSGIDGDGKDNESSKMTSIMKQKTAVKPLNTLRSPSPSPIIMKSKSGPSTPSSTNTNTQQSTTSATRKKVTIPALRIMYDKGIPIAMLTAHDYPSALMADAAGIDVILVGDSLAMVALGHETTLPITMDEMIHHCKAVTRGSKLALKIGDMPFGSYESGHLDAISNATRFLKEGGMEAVKLEGCYPETISKMVKSGIPVLGHLGLTPQRVNVLGGYRVQGRTAEDAEKLLMEAKELEKAGCFAIVLECVPAQVAKWITETISIPTIGIGAGSDTSGQVLVQQDMLGVFDKFVPKFCQRYAALGSEGKNAIQAYISNVRDKSFPGPQHSFTMEKDQLRKIKGKPRPKKK